MDRVDGDVAEKYEIRILEEKGKRKRWGRDQSWEKGHEKGGCKWE